MWRGVVRRVFAQQARSEWRSGVAVDRRSRTVSRPCFGQTACDAMNDDTPLLCPCPICNAHGPVPSNWRLRQWRRAYSAYLRSQHWMALRQKVLARARAKCELCRITAAEHVHHLTYECVGGHELLSDLQALCEDCHEDVHSLPDAFGRFGRLPPIRDRTYD